MLYEVITQASLVTDGFEAIRGQDQIGLLDDDYFFSLEDMDLGWRA